MLKFDSPVTLCVTSYEVDENGSTPILCHCFFGQDLKQAVAIATSHLKSDIFFNATFMGEMDWKDDKIYIEYDGQIISKKIINNKQQTLNKILKKLEKEGRLINGQQKRLKILEKINHLSTL